MTGRDRDRSPGRSRVQTADHRRLTDRRSTLPPRPEGQRDDDHTISDRHLRLAAEAASSGLWMLDGTTGVYWMTDVTRALFGFGPDEEVTLASILDAIHPDDREAVQAAIRRTIETGQEDAVEYRFVRSDGQVLWVQSRGRVHAGDTGEIPNLMGVSIDVTPRRKATEELAEQLRFETMLSDLSAGFVNIPPSEVDEAIVEAQRQVCECLGFDMSTVWQWAPADPDNQILTHLYRPLGGPPVPERMNGRETFPWCLDLLLAREPIIVPCVDEVPPEAARDREVWRYYGVKSVFTFPLAIAEGPLFGLLNLNTSTEERAMTPQLMSRLQTVAEVFASALDRKRADEALRRSLDEIQRLRDQLELENLYLKDEYRLHHGRGRTVGESEAILEVLALVEKVAPTSSTVLVQGETGTGKELVAHRIHDLSPRRDRPMVKVNCAALPSTLVESELFGREKGAYTGAVSRELGRFEIANGSTLFLDEISELPLDLQAKLLRVLEQGEFERVGSSRTYHTNVRVIAATNRDLPHEVEQGRFRQDLYYRLAVFPIRVPPLRDRREDVPLLVWSAVEEFSVAMNKAVESISRRDMERLQAYGWPGNVRELRNVVERAMILSSGPVLRIPPPGEGAPNGRAIEEQSAEMTLDDAQRQHIARVLDTTGGRISGPGGAAEKLGVKPTTLRSKMKRLQLEPRNDGLSP